MKKATTHYAKTHLSRLLKEVREGETVIITSGKEPVAKLIAYETNATIRPKVGTVTSEPVEWDEASFRPLDADELEEWGL